MRREGGVFSIKEHPVQRLQAWEELGVFWQQEEEACNCS